jgi:RNA polymerase sigma-70 factor (ECF subfamily)
MSAAMSTGATDAEITEWALAAREGDRSATERFIRATQRDVWRFVAYFGDRRDADDLAQETYLRALRSLPRFAARSSARSWLLSIARRVVVDQVRYAQVRPRCANLADWQGMAEHKQLRSISRFEDVVDLGELIDSLDPSRREAFLLTQEFGLSYMEASEACGCPVGTIRSRVARAREDLVVMLDNAQGTDNLSAG